MVKRKKKTPEGGTLVRGADGRLYFISDSKLRRYAKRIPPRDERKVARASGKRLAKALKDIKVMSSEVASVSSVRRPRRRP
jgi:hypothetical protein